MRSKLGFILFCLLAIVSLVEFNRTYLIPLTVAQQRFDRVVARVSDALEKTDNEDQSLPQLIIMTDSKLPGLEGQLKLAVDYTQEDLSDYRRVLRLLELVRTAKIFNFSEPDSPSLMKVTAEIGEHHFESKLSAETVGQELSIQKFIILMQQYRENNENER